MAKKPVPILKRTLPQVMGILLVVLGAIGFLASADLSIEKIQLLKDPSYQPTCNISPILSCGSVMETDQAAAFGFPNMFIGLAGFAAVLTVGMALLAGAKFKRWFWLGLQAGALFGVIFVTWLQYQSIYTVGVLCPYCMVVWVVTIPAFLYIFIYNLREGHIQLPSRLKSIGEFIQRQHGTILIVWYLLIILAILEHFWYYWKTLI